MELATAIWVPSGENWTSVGLPLLSRALAPSGKCHRVESWVKPSDKSRTKVNSREVKKRESLSFAFSTPPPEKGDSPPRSNPKR